MWLSYRVVLFLCPLEVTWINIIISPLFMFTYVHLPIVCSLSKFYFGPLSYWQYNHCEQPSFFKKNPKKRENYVTNTYKDIDVVINNMVCWFYCCFLPEDSWRLWKKKQDRSLHYFLVLQKELELRRREWSRWILITRGYYREIF